MIVFVVNHFGIGPNKSKGDSPIATNPDGPKALACSLERMKPEAGKAHIFGLGNRVQASQDQAQPFCMSGLNPGPGPCLKKPGQALMLEASDHWPQCNL